MTTANSNKPAIDVMFDIETLSNDREKGIVLSVGYETFSFASPDAFPEMKSYVVINPDSSLQAGRVKDDEIVKIWKSYKERYRDMKRDIRDLGQGFESGWKEIYRELKTLSDFYTLHVWSKDIDLDFPMLESSMRDAGLIHREGDLPYALRNKYDVNTFLMIAKLKGWSDNREYSYRDDAISKCEENISQMKSAWYDIKHR